MNADRERALPEPSRRNPFWICLVVFAALAVDAGFRLAKALDQRPQLDRARLNQTAITNRIANAFAQMPKLEAKLQAVSVDLVQLGRTNAIAAQLIREFNISWTPGTENTTLTGTNPAATFTNATPTN